MGLSAFRVLKKEVLCCTVRWRRPIFGILRCFPCPSPCGPRPPFHRQDYLPASQMLPYQSIYRLAPGLDGLDYQVAQRASEQNNPVPFPDFLLRRIVVISATYLSENEALKKRLRSFAGNWLEWMNELLLNAQRIRFGQSSEKWIFVLEGSEKLRLFNKPETVQGPKELELTEDALVKRSIPENRGAP